MENILSPLLFGILGGLVRALVGIVKYFENMTYAVEYSFSRFDKPLRRPRFENHSGLVEW